MIYSGVPGKRAFTLVPMIVDIVIIVFLAAVLFPVFVKARDKGRQITCLSNVKQMAAAYRMYEDDWGGGFYPGWVGFGYPVQTVHINYYLWNYTGSPKYDLNDWANCRSPWEAGTQARYPMYYCPSNPGVMYHVNSMAVCAPSTDRPLTRSEFENSPTKILILESNPSYWAGFYGVPRAGGFSAAETVSGGRLYTGHNGGQNVAFIDGHAAWMDNKTIDVNVTPGAFTQYWWIVQN